MESYEIILDNKKYPIKAINNLGGHNIRQGIIHGGIFLPSVDMTGYFPSNYRFNEGVYAVETFGSTGQNYTNESAQSECNLYRLNPDKDNQTLHNLNSNVVDFYKNLYNNFKTLPFTDRYVELFNINEYKSYLNILRSNKFIYSYPPVCVNQGAYTAQYEHTVYIGEGKKIVFSQSDDY